MKRPKMKCYNNYYLVYTDRNRAFKCYDLKTARFYYNFLKGAKV